MQRSHRFFISIFSILIALAVFINGAEGQQIVRIQADSPQALKALHLPKGLEMVGQGLHHVDFLVNARERAELDRLGIAYRVEDYDVEATLQEARASYHTLAQMESILSTTASTYPSITTLTSLGQTYQSRDVWCLEISDNPGVDEGETELLFTGLHHAREWPSVEMCLRIIDELTSNYGSDPTITNWVNNYRIFVITCVNPDGYYYCHDQGHDWRHNRHFFPQFNSYGVDNNRNYPGAHAGIAKGDWGSVGDGSVTHNYAYETYCGPGSGSELETQHVMDFVLAHDLTILISYHTYSELVIWPWGFDGSVHAPDNSLLVSTGQAMASRISGVYGGTYTPEQAAGLYPTSGDTTDWAYGAYYYTQGKNVLPYTVEMGTTFQPSTSQLDGILNENWDAVEYLFQQADTIKGSMTPFVLPPVLAAPQMDNDGNYTVSWTETNPDANPTLFQLDELSGLTVVTDGAESGTTKFVLDGFTTSTTQKHTGTRSFRAANQDERISTMTTKDPYVVTAGDQLDYWTWYDIENNWDFGFVEVSRDQRAWEQLAHYTGNSGGWDHEQFSLDAYAGDSIYIRFRYSTDSNTLGSGWYVDDLYPVPQFTVVNTLSNSIAGHSFDVTGNTAGDYYYRVRGYSATRGWGDFSILDMTSVEPPAGPLYADTYSVSAGAGFVVNFTLDAGAGNGGRDYLLLGSFSGSAPGLPLPGGLATLPLNWDGLTDWVIAHLGTPACVNFLGTLDGGGSGGAVLNSNGPINHKFVGRTMTFAYLLGPNPYYDYVSNAIAISIGS